MLAIFKHRLTLVGRPFLALMASDALTLMSLMVGMVALPWWIVHQGGARDLALYGVSMGVLSFVSIPLLAPFGDRISKRTLITAGLSAYAIEAMVVAWLASRHIYSIHLLIALEAIPVIALGAMTPAMANLPAELVAPEHLSTALSLQKGAQSVGRLLGPALSGALLAAFNTAVALWAHALLLGCSILLAARLPAAIRRQDGSAAGIARWWRDLKAGMRANFAIPMERSWTLVNFVSWIFAGPALGMLVPLKVKSLGLSGAWLGGCEAALSLGMLAGTLGIAGWIIGRLGRYHARVLAASLQGAMLGIAGFTGHPWLLVSCFCLTGMANAVVILVGMTHRTLARPEAYRSRMAATGLMTSQIATALGPALAGSALTCLPVDWVYGIFGLVSALTSLALAGVPGFKEFMALNHDEVVNWYGIHFPQAFRD